MMHPAAIDADLPRSIVSIRLPPSRVEIVAADDPILRAVELAHELLESGEARSVLGIGDAAMLADLKAALWPPMVNRGAHYCGGALHEVEDERGLAVHGADQLILKVALSPSADTLQRPRVVVVVLVAFKFWCDRRRVICLRATLDQAIACGWSARCFLVVDQRIYEAWRC